MRMQVPSSAELGVTYFLHLRNETVDMDAPDCNPFPNGSRVEVWWPGDWQWYVARVVDTRIELHKIKGAQVPCHEVYCHYELDNHKQWHSLHNNKLRMAKLTAGA